MDHGLMVDYHVIRACHNLTISRIYFFYFRDFSRRESYGIMFSGRISLRELHTATLSQFTPLGVPC